MQDKTNVMRILDSKKIEYEPYYYDKTQAIAGVEVATLLGENLNEVFKTLVTVSQNKKYFVFIVPVEKELDLKKAAKAVGQKSIEMIKQKELLALTGYIHGGCSPIGMKKYYDTVIDESVVNLKSIYISAGKVGAQIKIKYKDLKKVIDIIEADIVKEQ